MGLLSTIFSSVNPTDILIGLLSLTCLYTFHFYYKHFTRINPCPGPIPIPFVGNFAVLKYDVDTFFHKLNKIYGRNGLYEINIAGTRRIVVTRAEDVERLFANNSSAHSTRTPNTGLLDLFDFDKKGIGMNHDYKHWKFNRHIFSQFIIPLSSTNKPDSILNPLFEEMAKYWIDPKQQGGDGTVIDMTSWMRRFTGDFVSLLAAGKRISFMKHYHQKLKNEPITKEMIHSEEFIGDLDYFLSNNRIVFSPKSMRGLPIIKQRVDKLLDVCNRLYDKLVDIVRERRKEIAETVMRGDFNTKGMDLLTSLIIANTQLDPHPQKNLDPSLQRPMTDNEIRNILLDTFSAGTNTTVNTFCFAIHYITHHPNVKKKLLEEIESVFKDDPTRPITLEDVAKLEYCEAIIKETSRKRSTISILSRYTTRPDEIGGHKWPANTNFVMHFSGINNNPLYWKEPEKFMPERFYKSQETHTNSFLMFGGGARICPGRKVAMLELKILLALLYRKFDVELVDMQAPLKVKTSTTVRNTELMVKVIPKEKLQAKSLFEPAGTD